MNIPGLLVAERFGPIVAGSLATLVATGLVQYWFARHQHRSSVRLQVADRANELTAQIITAASTLAQGTATVQKLTPQIVALKKPISRFFSPPADDLFEAFQKALHGSNIANLTEAKEKLLDVLYDQAW